MNSLCVICAVGVLVLESVAARPGQSAETGPAFEVASVKVAAPLGGVRDEGGPGTASPGQWTCMNMPLNALVIRAWDLNPLLLSAPSSIADARYDIVAKVPPGASRSDFNLMIRRLLIERLGLAVHHERKEQRVQELIVAKGGIKMKAAELAPAGAADAATAAPQLSFDDRGNPQVPPGHPVEIRFVSTHGFFIVGRMQGIDSLSRALEGRVNQIVLDKTGLTGTYDYTLKLPRPATARPSPAADSTDAPPATAVPEAGTPGESVDSAIVEQLGLQLRSARAVVDFLVVDSFSKVPSEN